MCGRVRGVWERWRCVRGREVWWEGWRCVREVEVCERGAGVWEG